MRKALMWIGGGIAVLVVGLLILISMQPATTHVERSRTIAATPADLWPYVSDLHGFTQWSPWEERDPNQVSEFSEPASGVGAWYSWKGNDKVGSGKMTITAVEPERKVVQDLEFIEPFPSKAVVTLAMVPTEGGTEVTWGFDSENGFMAKAMCLVMSMDAMLGPDFEKGLEKLAGKAEADAAARTGREKAEAEAAASAAVTEDGAAATP